LVYKLLAKDRRKTGREIDYIIQHGNSVVPLEVKSEKAGSMKSLHHFCEIWE